MRSQAGAWERGESCFGKNVPVDHNRPARHDQEGDTRSSDVPSLEEIRRMRRDHKRRLEEKMRQVRFVSEDDWLALALDNKLSGMTSTKHDILISVRGVAEPSLGQHWTGLLVIDPSRRHGHAWFNEITGIVPIDETVRVYDGDRRIGPLELDKLLDLFERHELSDFRDVPNRCYDGAPTEVKIRTRSAGKVIEASANACDDGCEATLELVRVIWPIKTKTELSTSDDAHRELT